MPPDFSSYSGQAKVRASAELGARTARKLDQLDIPVDQKFDVAVTDYDSSTSSYTWHRVFPDGNGAYYDDPVNLAGSPTYAPLKERNGVVLSGISSSAPHYAQAWLRLGASSVGPIFEFTAFQPTAATGPSIDQYGAPSPWGISAPAVGTSVVAITIPAHIGITGLYQIVWQITGEAVPTPHTLPPTSYSSVRAQFGFTGTATLYPGPLSPGSFAPFCEGWGASGGTLTYIQMVNVTAGTSATATMQLFGGESSGSQSYIVIRLG